MEVKYLAKCIVKKNHKTYSRGSIIEDLTPDEIERGLAEQWLEKVGNDEEPETARPAKPAKAEKPPKTLDQMNKAELLALAAEKGIEAGDSMTVAELKKKIKEAPNKKTVAELLAEAAALGVTGVDDSMTVPDLEKKIAEAKAAT